MASLEEIRAGRLAKLSLLKKAGMNPFPIESGRDFELATIKADFEKLSAKKNDVTIAGRIMAIRGQGAIQFIPLFDGTGTFQAVIKKDVLDPKLFELFGATVDIGDIVEVSGDLFLTQKGEKSLQVKSWKMLAKSLRPLPEKWNGLQDVEERFRRRYLDTVMSEEVRNRFVIRSKTVTAMRAFLDRAGYLEVETPALQPLAGGTNAEPFKTHHKALDIDLFLRIAPELYLKKLLIGGFPKVYEIGRNFRNEGIDVTHNPEFTMLEFYEAFSTAARQMNFVESMFKDLVSKVLGADSIDTGETKIDFSKPFARITYKDLVAQGAGIDPITAPIDTVVKTARKLGVTVDRADSREKIIDNIYKKVSRPKVIQPTFITDYPVNMLPLAKRSEKDPSVVDVFQLVVGGMELVKAFSELNDPIDQRERFTKEEENAKAGDAEAQPNDEEFIEALEYGMPPAGGVGIGIDRLAMLLTNTKNIKEVILFPTMRPRESEGTKSSKKEREIAVAIINESAAAEGWQKLNTAAHLGASLAARLGRSLLHTDTISTKDGDSINLNIQHAIVLKVAQDNSSLIDLAAAAKTQGLRVEQFTREMIVHTNDKKVIAQTLEKDSKDVERLGVLVFGPKDAVDALTVQFPLAK